MTPGDPHILTLNRRQFLLLGSVGLGMGMSRSGIAAGIGPQQNIAARGQIHNGTAAASGIKTRFKGIYRFTIGAGGALSLAPVFANFWLNNALAREVDGAAAYTIRKAAISYEGRCVPLMFSGQRSVRVLPGTVDLQPDAVTPPQFGVSRFLPGYVAFVRLSLDVPAGQTVAGHANPMYLGGESLLRYDPLNDIDDIDATGWAEPAGADQWVAFPGPIMLAGTPDTPVTSVVGIGDSIVDGSNDSAGDGSTGGGWLRRATFAAKLPYLSISRTGEKAQFVAASNLKTRTLLRYGHAAVVALGNNDIRDGRTQAELLADLRAIWTMLRVHGIRRVAQAQVLSETVSADQTTSIAGQSVRSGFGAGSVRAQINAVIATLDDGRIDDQIDISSPVQSSDKWNVPVFSATLSAATAVWSGSLSLDEAPTIGDFLALESETPANHDAVWPHVTEVAGSGPYAVTLTGGPTKAHAAGAHARLSLAADGIHPQQQAHRAMAIKAAPALRRAGSLKTAWVNPAKSIEIDFVNRRAQINGTVVPIDSCVSCIRASEGKAFDGLSWFDFGNDGLRHVDGGGLFVEPTRTNLIRNSTMAGGVAPDTKPDNWAFHVPEGIEIANLAYGIENGIAFVDTQFVGTGAKPGILSIDADSGIATAAGETWSHSAFVALLHNSAIAPAGIMIGGRASNSEGAEIEFPASANLAGALSRQMTRQSFVFTLTEPDAVMIRPCIAIHLAKAFRVDITIRLGLPQLERAVSISSPIATHGSRTETRVADEVSIALPVGIHDLTVTFDDGSMQTVRRLGGAYRLPTTFGRSVINTLSAVRTG